MASSEWAFWRGGSMENEILVRLRKIIENYEDGLTTYGEFLCHILATVSPAIIHQCDRVEQVLFEKTGKRPYELGL